MSDYANNILNAIEKVAENIVDKAGFPRVISAIIQEKDNNVNQKYRCKYQDSLFDAYPVSDNSFSIGDSVYVLLPTGQMSDSGKQILGLVSALSEDYERYANSYLCQFNGTNYFKENPEIKLCSYSGEQVKIIDNLNIDVDLSKRYLQSSQSNKFYVKAKFRTNLAKEQQQKGEYGLKFFIKWKKSTNESFVQEYVLNLNDVNGDPYSLDFGSNADNFYDIPEDCRFDSLEYVFAYSKNFPVKDLNKTDDDIFIYDFCIVGGRYLEESERNGYLLIYSVSNNGCFEKNKDIQLTATLYKDGIKQRGAKFVLYKESLKGFEEIDSNETGLFNIPESSFSFSKENSFKITGFIDDNSDSKQFSLTNDNAYEIYLESSSGSFVLSDLSPVSLKCRGFGDDPGYTYSFEWLKNGISLPSFYIKDATEKAEEDAKNDFIRSFFNYINQQSIASAAENKIDLQTDNFYNLFFNLKNSNKEKMLETTQDFLFKIKNNSSSSVYDKLILYGINEKVVNNRHFDSAIGEEKMLISQQIKDAYENDGILAVFTNSNGELVSFLLYNNSIQVDFDVSDIDDWDLLTSNLLPSIGYLIKKIENDNLVDLVTNESQFSKNRDYFVDYLGNDYVYGSDSSIFLNYENSVSRYCRKHNIEPNLVYNISDLGVKKDQYYIYDENKKTIYIVNNGESIEVDIAKFGDTIYNISSRNIGMSETIKCKVTRTKTSDGSTASAIVSQQISVDLKDSRKYYANIENGEQTFLYDEIGKIYDGYIAKPLSFSVIRSDENGSTELTSEEIINHTSYKAYWKIHKNSLFSLAQTYSIDNSLSQKGNWDYYNVNDDSFSFSVSQMYNFTYANNSQIFFVLFNNNLKVLEQKVNIIFVKQGSPGSNGTGYVCTVKVNYTGAGYRDIGDIAPAIVLEKGKNPRFNFDSETITDFRYDNPSYGYGYPANKYRDFPFSVELFKDGSLVTLTDNYKVKWGVFKNKYLSSSYETNNLEDPSPLQFDSSGTILTLSQSFSEKNNLVILRKYFSALKERNELSEIINSIKEKIILIKEEVFDKVYNYIVNGINLTSLFTESDNGGMGFDYKYDELKNAILCKGDFSPNNFSLFTENGNFPIPDDDTIQKFIEKILDSSSLSKDLKCLLFERKRKDKHFMMNLLLENKDINFYNRYNEMAKIATNDNDMYLENFYLYYDIIDYLYSLFAKNKIKDVLPFPLMRDIYFFDDNGNKNQFFNNLKVSSLSYEDSVEKESIIQSYFWTFDFDNQIDYFAKNMTNNVNTLNQIISDFWNDLSGMDIDMVLEGGEIANTLLNGNLKEAINYFVEPVYVLEPEELIMSFLGESLTPALVIQCSIQDSSTGKWFYGYLPLTIINEESGGGEYSEGAQYRLALVEGSGFRNVVYKNDGANPDYAQSSPFEVKVQKRVTVLKSSNEYNYIWEDDTDNNWEFIWNSAGSYFDFTNNGFKYKNSDDLIVSYMSDNYSNKQGFSCVNRYNGLCKTNAIQVFALKKDVPTLSLTASILFTLNAFGLSQINEWDGNSIQINEEGGYILAPQIGAGKKDENNRFTGLIMGEVKEVKNQNISSTANKNGMLGYSKGEQTIFLNADNGAAIFGKTGGRIVIDPSQNKALLYSDNYFKNYDDFGLPSDYSQTAYENLKNEYLLTCDLLENLSKVNNLENPSLYFCDTDNFATTQDLEIKSSYYLQVGDSGTDIALLKKMLFAHYGINREYYTNSTNTLFSKINQAPEETRDVLGTLNCYNVLDSYYPNLNSCFKPSDCFNNSKLTNDLIIKMYQFEKGLEVTGIVDSFFVKCLEADYAVDQTINKIHIDSFVKTDLKTSDTNTGENTADTSQDTSFKYLKKLINKFKPFPLERESLNDYGKYSLEDVSLLERILDGDVVKLIDDFNRFVYIKQETKEDENGFLYVYNTTPVFSDYFGVISKLLLKKYEKEEWQGGK